MRRLIFILIAAISSCKNENEPIYIDIQNEVVTPKNYIVAKAEKNLLIDGLANEQDWENAPFTDLFIDIEGIKIPRFDTKAKMLWDDNYFYVFAQMEEQHIWGSLKQRDTVIFYNNDFELFISPSGTVRNYGEVEINALGTVWDLLLDRPYRDSGNANNHWNLDDLKTAVKVYGSLNNPNDEDSLWTVEMAVPMKALVELKSHPKNLPVEGEQWRLNFSRVQWGHEIVNGTYFRKKENDKYLPEYNWSWSPQKVINMHEPEKWGTIQFTTLSSSNNITFIDNPYLAEEQVAYALYRRTIGGIMKDLLEEKAGFIQRFRIKYSESNDLEATFYKTNFGFEYEVYTPLSDYKIYISDSGILKRKETR